MDKDNLFQEIQGILPLGYIYLIVMGILQETLYYNQIGINILAYSSIFDILISPIAELTSSISSLAIFIAVVVVISKIPSFLAKNKYKNWFGKLTKLDANLTEKEIHLLLLKKFMLFLAFLVFGFFIGTGIGEGLKMSKKIEKGEIKYNDHLHFITGEKEIVEIVGSNSLYIFYLEKDNKAVQITPISGIIKSMEVHN